MNPTLALAIELAEDFYSKFQPAEIVDEDTDIILMHEPVLLVSDAIEIYTKRGFPAPAFDAWAQQLTDNKLANKRIRYQVASKILCTMKERKITQADLALMLNKQPSQINQMIGGNMTIDSIYMFEKILGIKLLDLS